MRRWSWLLLFWGAGCVGTPKPDSEADADGDGILATEDCDDADANVGGPSTWYTDADGDSFGADASAVVACVTTGVVAVGGDCDDTDPATYPAAEENCEEEVDRNCDGSLAFEDGDGDGFAACLECDDSDRTVNPSAPERCNEVDDDCDGQTDEDATDAPTWYPDQDGDAFGTDSGATQSCTGPAGYTTEAGDCDDDRSNVNPDAVESCGTSYDDDCDGDSNEQNADRCESWYEDLDADGFGGVAEACLCEATRVYTTTDGGDCNDADIAINPGATEDCSTTEDDNCDGAADAVNASGCTDWMIDADADGYGGAGSQCTCAPLGSYTATSSEDCDDSAATISPAQTEDCSTAADDNCDGLTDATNALNCSDWYADGDGDGWGAGGSLCTCAAPAGYPANDNLDCDDGNLAISPDGEEDCSTTDDDNCDGSSNDVDAIACTDYYLDSDRDGFGNATSQCTCIATGSYTAANMSDCDDGTSTVNPSATETCATAADDDCDGNANEVNADACINYYPDGDGDGYGDGMATCTCSGGSGTSTSSSDCDDTDGAVFPGAPETCNNGIDDNCDGGVNSCEPTDTALATGTILYTGERAEDGAGTVAMVGDVNGDGYDDMYVGAPYNDDGGQDMGTSYLIKGSASPRSGALSSAVQFMNTYAAGGLYSGHVLAAAGDVDSDGYDDMLMGGDGQYSFLIRGSANPTSGYTTAAIRWTAPTNSDEAGDALAGGGDVNGDGYPDVLVGAWSGDTASSNAGSVYIILGSSSPASGTLTGNVVYSGENQNDYLGYSVANAKDVDADGMDDMLLGAIGNDDGASSGGAAYLMFGGSSLASSTVAGQVQYWGTTYRDESAYVAGPGDVNGDGYADMLIGGPGVDAGATDGGAIYLIYGSASPSSHSLATYDGRILGDSTNLGIGDSVAGAGDVNADGLADVLFGGNYSTTGAGYLVLGKATLGTVYASAADARYTGEQASDVAGAYVGGGGDVDADGYDDLLVGAPGNDDAGSSAGTVYLILGIGL